MSAEPNRKKAYSADDPSILQNSPKFKYSCRYSSSDLSCHVIGFVIENPSVYLNEVYYNT